MSKISSVWVLCTLLNGGMLTDAMAYWVGVIIIMWTLWESTFYAQFRVSNSSFRMMSQKLMNIDQSYIRALVGQTTHRYGLWL